MTALQWWRARPTWVFAVTLWLGVVLVGLGVFLEARP